MTDPLAELKTKLAKVQATPDADRFLGPWSLREVTWLIGEVERLRGLEAEVRVHCDAVWRMDMAATTESDVRMAELVGLSDPPEGSQP